MKVLMVAPEPFFEPRGTPISVYQRLHALSAFGYKVDLVTYPVGQDVNIPGVKIRRIFHIPSINHVKIGPSWAKLFLDVLLFFQVIYLLATTRYDVIHSHEEAAFFSAFLAKVFRTRHLYDMHSSLPHQLRNFSFGNYWLFIKLFEILEKWVLNTCDAVITIGADLEEYVKQVNPAVAQIKIENLAVHSFNAPPSNGSVDSLKRKLGLNDKFPIVYTGTFERYQGLDLLLESAKIVRQHNQHVSFVLVGGTSDQVDYWQNKAQKYQLEDCVQFVSAVSPAEALIYLEIAEILVSPRIEGTSVPLKIYSYLHSGKPIVATKLMAHTQVLNRETAILVEPTAKAVAHGILELIQAPNIRQQLGRQALSLAIEKFNPADYLKKVAYIYYMLNPSTDNMEPVHLSTSYATKHPSSAIFPLHIES